MSVDRFKFAFMGSTYEFGLSRQLVKPEKIFESKGRDGLI